jgi:preprotein translocase subunit SecD
MLKNVRWRLTLTVAVIVLAIVAFYPPQQKINLGLDLKGGVHLVLKVRTDDALRAETETTAERLRDTLTRSNVQHTKLEVTAPDEFRIEGVQDDAALRDATTDVDTTYDRSSSAGGVYTYRIKPNIANQLRSEAVTQALETIERRVNELGVAEPIVSRHGGQDQILVQLPGVDNPQRAKEIIRTTAQLQLRSVEQGPFPSREAAQQVAVTPDVEVLPGRQEGSGTAGTAGTVYYVVKRVSVVSGNDLRNAAPSLDEFNRPAVSFTLKQDAAARFGNFTQANIGKLLGIILDGRVMSVATIQGRIFDNGQINGISREEAADLVITLKSGALPASMTYLEERTVGPSLGAESIRAGVLASLGGLGLVVVFMLAYYKLTGLNAIVSIGVNLLILLGMMAYLGATMTLPGIAGFILTIGMGVDSNVLIFERIKEELATARGARAAVNAGFDRVWWTIVDTHVASLIAAAFLFQFGTGPIRGFATTLTIGLLSNVFTAVFVSRTVFELVLARRGQAQTLSI